MDDVDSADDAVARAARELYAVGPDEFLDKRGELVARAKADNDGDAARAIGKLRKPTVAAWMVNALVLSDDSVREQIGDLGDRLRDAQQALDATSMRQLSRERRGLVADLTEAAVRLAGRAKPSTAAQDEVRATFDAAVADPGVADRLGALQRAESFSGFGFGDAAGGPQLTLVQGGRTERAGKKTAGAKTASAKTTSKTAGKKAAGKKAAAVDREAQRAAAERQRVTDKAREQVQQAEDDVRTARAAEKDTADQVKAAERALAEAKAALTTVKADRDKARDAHRAALATRRDARRALDRVVKGR